MGTVYRLVAWGKYQRLEPTKPEEFIKLKETKWRFDGTEIGRSWKPPDVYVRLPMYEAPDIWGTFAGSHVFAFEEKARDLLQLYLDQCGEQLPLFYEGRKLTLLNPTYVLNCLDKENSRNDPNFDLPDMFEQYAFHAERLDYSLFMIPETRTTELFCVEGLTADGNEFKAKVEKHRLKGLYFEELWSNQPTPFTPKAK